MKAMKMRAAAIGGLLAMVAAGVPAAWAQENSSKWAEQNLLVREPRTEKATFLGVTTSSASGVLREQLGLPKGMGLVVDFVAKDSPAEAAGVKVHDVLQKLDDQLLVNMEQLAVLVRSRKAGETVMLTVFRGAKPVTLEVKLVEKELPVMEEMEGLRMLPPGGGNLRWQAPGESGMRMEAPEEGVGNPWHKELNVRVVPTKDGSTMQTMTDASGEITITTGKDGKALLVAKDKEGKEIFRGPYTTVEEKGKVPEAIGERVKKMPVRAMAVGGGKETGWARVVAGEVSVEVSDGGHDITIQMTAEGKTVKVKDAKTGAVLYDGPANTEEDMKKLPEGVAEKVKKLSSQVIIETK